MPSWHLISSSRRCAAGSADLISAPLDQCVPCGQDAPPFSVTCAIKIVPRPLGPGAGGAGRPAPSWHAHPEALPPSAPASLHSCRCPASAGPWIEISWKPSGLARQEKDWRHRSGAPSPKKKAPLCTVARIRGSRRGIEWRVSINLNDAGPEPSARFEAARSPLGAPVRPGTSNHAPSR